MNLHIMTGASRGLGAGLARALVARGDQVVNISRTASDVENVKNYQCDLSETGKTEAVLHRVFSEFPIANFKKITLINNAAMVEPVKQVVKLSEEEVRRALNLNVLAPFVLTAAFLQRTSEFSGTRIVVNVSSGVAHNPKKSWAVYCASKAALESFSETLCLEYAGSDLVKIINVEPGIVDTAMQEAIRGVPDADFDDRERFVRFKQNGELLAPEKAGTLLADFLLRSDLPLRNFISIYDLLN